MTIGYLTPHFYQGLHLSYYLGVLEGARECNVNLLCFNGSMYGNIYENANEANKIFDHVTPETVDGIVCWTSGLKGAFRFLDFEKILTKNPNIPIVCIGTQMHNFPTVVGNNTLGISQLMTHLIEVHNYKKIAFIKGPDNHPPSIGRYEGYIEELKKYNIPFDEKLVSKSGDFVPKTGEKGIAYFLDELKLKPKIDFDAIITPSDLISVGAIKEMQRRGIKVPKEVAVVGFNNREEGLEITPQLTSIDLKFSETGKVAIKTVIALVEGKKVGDIIDIPTNLIIRESCGCQPPEYCSKTENVYKISNGKKTIFKKDDIIKNLNNYIKDNFEFFYDQKWTEKIINSLEKDLLSSDDENFFIESLIDIFNEIFEKNYNIQIWQPILTKLRSLILPDIDNKSIEKAENIFHNARSFIFRKLDQSIIVNKIKNYRHQEIFPTISNTIVTTFDINKLIKIIETELPKLGISACYISLYLTPQESIDTSQLILGYDENGHIDLNKYDCVYQSHLLLPEGILKKDKRFEIIIKPLFFQNTPLGFILFKVSNIDSSIYYTLRGYISSALQGATLVKNIEDHAKELELAYKTLKNNQEKLIISEKMASLGRLTAGIAHEMNTPLASVRASIKELDSLVKEYEMSIGNPDVLPEDHIEITKDMKKYLNIAFQALEKSAGFLKGIKTQTYTNVSKNKQAFNADEVLTDTLNILEYLFISNMCILHKETESNLIIFGDPKSFGQIITNLITNAIDACKTNKTEKRIGVILKKKNKIEITLTINDNGIGISKENMKKIFDPFFTTKKFGEGTGLGLSIVHELVNEFNAKIDIQSVSGKTEFIIDFPLH
jgi:DNA-binding LacI/PurR family transcriptional regulator/signal transduction histidine kinase